MRSERILGVLGMSFSEWREVKLEDIIEIEMGQSPKSEFYNQTGEGLPFLQGNRTFGDKYPYFDTYCTENKKIANKNDVIMSVRAPVGDLNIAQTQISLGRGVCAMRLKGEQNSNYLFYLMKHNIKEMINRESGTVFGSVNKKDILGLDVKITNNKLEQKAIAHILSILDDKIEVNNEINKTLENMAQVIFKQWFVDFEFPNEDGEPYKSSGGEMVESELGMIPKGWEVKKVEQVTKIIRGASPRPIQDFIRDEGIPWVKISDASSSNTRFISSTKEFIKEEGRKKSREVKVGTLILSNSATPGIPMIMKIDACVHDGWLIFDEFREVTKEYMFHFLTENRIGILSLSNGSVFRNLKTDILKNYKIIIPSRDVVARVDNIFKSINNSIDNIENQITTLTKIRDGLLTKLMSGEIRVPLDEEGDVS